MGPARSWRLRLTGHLVEKVREREREREREGRGQEVWRQGS